MTSGFLWVVPASAFVFVEVGLFLVNEHFRIRSLHMLFWMRLCSVLVLFPWASWCSWPENWQFYALMFFNGFIISYVDIILIGLTARSGAGVTTRLTPLVHGMIFILWLAVTPSLLGDYLAKPLRSAGILLSLASCIWFALNLKKCKVSFDALKIALPALMLGAVAIVIGRMAMDYAAEGLSGVYQYVALQCATVLFFYFLFQTLPFVSARIPHLGMESKLFDRRVLAAGGLAALAWTIATPLKWFAIMQVENPAYVTMFGLSVPFLVLLFYRMLGRREEVDVVSGLGMVVSTAMLVFFSGF